MFEPANAATVRQSSFGLFTDQELAEILNLQPETLVDQI